MRATGWQQIGPAQKKDFMIKKNCHHLLAEGAV